MTVVSTEKEVRMLIDGKLVASEADQWLESVNPADEQIIGRVPAATPADVR